MLSSLVGGRLPTRYHKFFKLPERKQSTAIVDTSNTPLGKLAGEWLLQHAATNGVCRLDVGSHALRVRLQLIELARSSLDIQSYLVRDDLSGNLIVMALITAAERGVRVRLLMDDAMTKPVDPGLLALGRHPNIEVRVFNPFPRQRSRFVSFIANFNLLNRRMHNKSFTVDSQVTIVGGRNLADEYFQGSLYNEFLDEDLLAIGNVVSDVSTGFDEYWNTRESIPIEFLKQPKFDVSIDEMVQEGTRFIEDQSAGRPVDSGEVVGPLSFGAAGLGLVSASAKLILDHPDKVRGLVRHRLGETTEYLRNMAVEAQRELIVVSPYFVPLGQGVRLFAALVKRGVRVIIVTNSLASTNHSSVHAVYARYRKPLLRAGVELYELRRHGESNEHDDGQPVKITLHSKLGIVDRHELFVGSFNLDPRSLYINTEMGMTVTSGQLASDAANSITQSLPRIAYRLTLSPRGKLRWSAIRDGRKETLYKEPHTTVWRRVTTWLMSLLPIESQM